jgi:CRP-like cAMP-binding protein
MYQSPTPRRPHVEPIHPEASAWYGFNEWRLSDSGKRNFRLIHEGDQPDVHLVLEGFACRYKLLPNGERQIMAYLVPGDWCDLHIAILEEMDHAIATLSACKIVEILRQTVRELTENHGRINRALW